MKEVDGVTLVQEYVNLLGRMYIILLSTLDDFAGVPLSTNEKIVLQILEERPASMKEVALMTGLALSTLTNVIDNMEEKQLVRRRPSRTDRRMIKIELKAEGRRVKSSFNSLVQLISSNLLAILSDRDRAAFIKALEVTKRALSSYETSRHGDIVGSLIEPLRMTLIRQLGRKRSRRKASS